MQGAYHFPELSTILHCLHQWMALLSCHGDGSAAIHASCYDFIHLQACRGCEIQMSEL